jgi:hypothetical protein
MNHWRDYGRRGGRPRALTAEVEDTIRRQVAALPRGEKRFAYFKLALAYGVSESTIERIVQPWARGSCINLNTRVKAMA